MRALSLAAAVAALSLGGCVTVTEYVNPCDQVVDDIQHGKIRGDQVVAAADDCMANRGERRQALVIRSEGNLQAEHNEQALADADAALAISQKHADAWYYRGMAHEAAGDTDAAEKDFDKAIGLIDAAMQNATAPAAGSLGGVPVDAPGGPGEAPPASVDIPIKLGQGSPEHVETAGKSVNRGNNNDPAVRQKQLVFIYAARGRMKFAHNDFAGGYRDFDTILAANPSDEEAYRMRGAAAAVLERFPQAEADFSKAIELDPKDLRAYSGRGYVKYLTHRYGEAIPDFRMALSQKPEGLKAAFLYQAMMRARDPDALVELQRQSGGLDLRANPGVFVALYLGQVSIDEEVSLAISTGKHKPHENEAEAYFYAGMAELFAGDNVKARTWFHRVLATGVIRFDEIRGARMELRDMGEKIPSPDPERPQS